MKTQTKNPIAEGVWLLASGIIIKSVIIAEKLAEKLLSKSAIQRGIRENNELIYPERDGRASIPMYELSQKGYLQLADEQIKEHFKRIVKLIPEYLAERGLMQREMYSLEDKLTLEHDEFTNSLKYYKPQEISEFSKEIFEINQIRNFAAKNDLTKILGIGLLISQEDLLLNIRQTMYLNVPVEEQEDFILTKESIGVTIGTMAAQATLDKKLVKDALEPFENELEVAKASKIKAVSFAINTAGTTRQVKMSLNEFYDIQDKALLDRFAKTEMIDFPNRDYYGEEGQAIYDELLKKRFCENIEYNFEAYRNNVNSDYSISLLKTFTKYAEPTRIEGMENRLAVKEVVENGYEDNQRALSNIAKYFKEQKDMLNGIQSLIQSSETKVGVTNISRNENNEIVAERSVVTETHTTDNKATPANESSITRKSSPEQEIENDSEIDDELER